MNRSLRENFETVVLGALTVIVAASIAWFADSMVALHEFKAVTCLRVDRVEQRLLSLTESALVNNRDARDAVADLKIENVERKQLLVQIQKDVDRLLKMHERPELAVKE